VGRPGTWGRIGPAFRDRTVFVSALAMDTFRSERR